MMKVCTKCNVDKELSEFQNRKDQLDGKAFWCKSCTQDYDKQRNSLPERIRSKRNASLKKLYGITLEEAEEILASQYGVCAICKGNVVWSSKSENKNQSACVDHCHETGVVRGILCNSCNRGLGFFKDDAEALEIAAGYLRNHG